MKCYLSTYAYFAIDMIHIDVDKEMLEMIDKQLNIEVCKAIEQDRLEDAVKIINQRLVIRKKLNDVK